MRSHRKKYVVARTLCRRLWTEIIAVSTRRTVLYASRTLVSHTSCKLDACQPKATAQVACCFPPRQSGIRSTAPSETPPIPSLVK